MISFAQASDFAQAYRKAVFLPVVPVAWAVTSVFGVVAAPFGSEQLTLPGRMLFWPVVVGGSILIGAALRVLVRDYFGWKRYPIEAPALAVLATLVLTPLCLAMAHLLADAGQYTPHWPEVAAYVYIVSMAVTSLRHALAAGAAPRAGTRRAGPATGQTEPDATAPQGAVVVALAPSGLPPARLEARIEARLDPLVRAPLVRLQMRNHYVDVVTEAGMDSLLLRLADAIAETDGVEGLQVHRSHWVARSAISGLLRGRGKVALWMSDGAVVPVSRRHLGVVLGLGLAEVSAPLPGFDEAIAAEAAQ